MVINNYLVEVLILFYDDMWFKVAPKKELQSVINNSPNNDVIFGFWLLKSSTAHNNRSCSTNNKKIVKNNI